MRKLKYSFSRNALSQIYMSFLLPVVEYALVTGLTRYVSLQNVFKECGWTTLSEIRHQHKLHSCIRKIMALYLHIYKI